MLNHYKKIVFFALLVIATASFADDSLRINMKSAITKGCISSAAKDGDFKNLNLNMDEYCTCTANGLIDGMTEYELKQAMLGSDKTLMHDKMMSAASLCMSSNSNAKAFVKNATYKGCNEKPSMENGILNKEAYCACVADKFSANTSQEDMRDFVAVGQGEIAIADTKAGDKMLGLAAECLNQTIK